MKIFVYDDESFAMAAYFRALEKAGHTLTRFVDVDEARKQLAESAPDLVILDVMMPPGSYGAEATGNGFRTGLVFLEDLRKVQPHVPVLILTNVDRTKIHGAVTEGPTVRILEKLEVLPADLPLIAAQFVRSTQ